jgi:hypothetical protein
MFGLLPGKNYLPQGHGAACKYSGKIVLARRISCRAFFAEN